MNQPNPRVTEWPASEKAQLERLATEQTVVVAYSGCEMRLLDRIGEPPVLSDLAQRDESGGATRGGGHRGGLVAEVDRSFEIDVRPEEGAVCFRLAPAGRERHPEPPPL
ncbi:MAG: hypothetical protein AAGN82_32005 [Myxococcota bacterium]